MCLGMGYAIVPKKGSLHQPTVGFVPLEWHLSTNLQVWMSENLTIPETNRSRRAQVPVTKKHMRLQIPMELRV